MMYFEWIIAALGVFVVYFLLGYAWLWWTARRTPASQNARPSRSAGKAISGPKT